ncbi:MAG: metallophosphoesterase family protein [Desulfuromonadaceae bacterium]|nr:metallophosphoesterase family protein [Desulfuromonadaceae bacterium]
MKLGILSDTHWPSLTAGRALAELLCQSVFRDVEAILHAGDMVHPDVAMLFAPLPFYGVCGNMDRANGVYPARRVLEMAGRRIGLIHGWGPTSGLEARVRAAFSDVALDVLIYGHSHQPVCHQVGNTLLLNPGSAADRRSAPCHSVALLSLDPLGVHAELINIDDGSKIV